VPSAAARNSLLSELDAVAASEADDAALARCDAVLAEAEQAGDVVAAARARFERARTLSRAGRTKESHEEVGEFVARYEREADATIRRLVCRGLFGLARDRIEAGVDRRVAISEYRHILAIAERDPPIDGLAASAHYHLALTYGKIAVERDSAEHRERALERFREVRERFGDKRSREVRRWVARAAMGQATMVSLDDAGALYESVFERHAKDTPEMQALALEALVEWAERCAKEGELDRAAEIADRARDAFSRSDDAALTALLARVSSLGA
jgi:hypothetical protein